MRPLSVLLLVAWAAATAAAAPTAGWSAGRELQFQYSTQVLSGIPELKNQFSGLRLSALVRVQSFTDSTLRIQFQDSKFKSHNGELDVEDIRKMGSDDGAELPPSIKVWLESPFKVYHKRGLVEKIQTECTEPEFVVNLKKALVSQLQWNLSKSRKIQKAQLSDQNQIPLGQNGTQRLPSFTSMEASVLGECETRYSIVQLPSDLVEDFEEEDRRAVPGLEPVCQGLQYYEVVKSKDLDKCQLRPAYQKTFGILPSFDGSMSSSHPSHSSVIRAIICGTPENYYIRRVNSDSRIISYALGGIESEEMLDINTVSNLQLISVREFSAEIQEPIAPKNYPSLVYEYGSGYQSPESLRKFAVQSGNGVFAPKPDLTSAPAHLLPRSILKEEISEKVISAIIDVVKHSKKINKNLEKDVAGVTTVISRSLHMLGFEELKKVEETLRTHHDVELTMRVFFDLLSVTGTNPCIKLLKEKVIGGEVSGEIGSWVISNALRSLKTPTEEILTELVELLKNDIVQNSRPMRAAVTLGLTELVHKACIDPLISGKEFPVSIYGQFCHEDSKVIKDELEPFLEEKIKGSSDSNISSAIIFVNALGNLGSKKSAELLLKIVERKVLTSPHVRSLAVYRLIRSAKINPEAYRNVFQSLIENPAENIEVRIAAITVLPFTSPSAATLQRLAIRTWFEPSKQVSSYIYSTLKALKNTPNTGEMRELSGKASLALPLCKPSFGGIYDSHNLQASHFIESLRTTVNKKLQWVTTEDSAIPKSLYTKTEVHYVDNIAEPLEATLYIQGAKYVIDQLYDLYSETMEHKDEKQYEQELEKNKEEVREKSSRLNIEPRIIEQQPEAHLTMKLMGLQKIYSLDSEFMTSIRGELESLWRGRLNLHEKITKEYLKVHDWFGMDYIFPTESGFPAYITRRLPVVTYTKAEIKPKQSHTLSGETKFEINFKTIVNYKKEVQGGVITPITDRAHSAGVDYVVFAALPITGEVSYNHGQITLNLKKPSHSHDLPMMNLSVRPFTTSCEVNKIRPAQLSSTSKAISSKDMKQVHQKFGRPLGIDLEVKMEGAESSMDFYSVLNKLKTSLPLSSASVAPMPFISAKKQSVSIQYDPSRSEVEEATINIAVGYVKKENKYEKIRNLFPKFTHDVDIKRICAENCKHHHEQHECKDSLKHKIHKQEFDSKTIEYCQLEQRDHVQHLHMLQQDQEKNQQQQQTDQEKQQVMQSLQVLEKEGEERFEECKIEMQLCKEERAWCEKLEEHLGKSSHETEAACTIKAKQCIQRRQNRKTSKEVLTNIGKGSALSVSASAFIKTSHSSESKHIETHLSIGMSEADEHQKTQISGNIFVEHPEMRKPFEVAVNANSQAKKLGLEWNHEDLIQENLSSKMQAQVNYGFQGEEKHIVKVDLLGFQSDEQKEFATQAAEQCEDDKSNRRQLSASCRESRKQSVSLDKVRGTVDIPSGVLMNPLAKLVSDYLSLALMPTTQQHASGSVETADRVQYIVEAQVSRNGEIANLTISGNGQETELKNIRLGRSAKGILPLSSKDTIASRLLQRLTSNNSPSSCTIEGGKIVTFDRKEYDYDLNNCEHVVFQDCSEKQRVSIYTKKVSNKQKITVVIDGHKYELEVESPTRHSRSRQVSVVVNGEEKQWKTKEDVEHDEQEIDQLIHQIQQNYEIKSKQPSQHELEKIIHHQDPIIKQQYREGRKNYYNDVNTYITNSKDGVVSVVSQKYGISVLCDGESIEVQSSQHLLRNTACGLCGDLNGEETVDVLSSKQCAMSDTKLAAFTYMLEDDSCQGVPELYKPLLVKEQERCVRKVEIPTKVSEIIRLGQQQPRSVPEVNSGLQQGQ